MRLLPDKVSFEPAAYWLARKLILEYEEWHFTEFQSTIPGLTDHLSEYSHPDELNYLGTVSYTHLVVKIEIFKVGAALDVVLRLHKLKIIERAPAAKKCHDKEKHKPRCV